jgi:hypothetical protein
MTLDHTDPIVAPDGQEEWELISVVSLEKPAQHRSI